MRGIVKKQSSKFTETVLRILLHRWYSLMQPFKEAERQEKKCNPIPKAPLAR